MERADRCKICGDRRLRQLKRYRAYPTTSIEWQEAFDWIEDLDRPTVIRLVVCQHCGFLFYRDTFSFAQLKHYYQQEARYQRPKTHQLKPGRIWELERLTGFLAAEVPFQRVKTALDLGAGDFIALDRIADLQPQIHFEALDPSYPHAKHNQIVVHRAMIEDWSPPRQYDLVTAIHILEHVGDLRHFMKKAWQLVAPSGYFYAEVPFQVSPGLLLGRAVNTQHINYFTPKSLERLVATEPFEVIARQFDTGSYRHNGMTGMIRLLCRKTKRKQTPNQPSSFGDTLSYLVNPIVVGRTMAGQRK